MNSNDIKTEKIKVAIVGGGICGLYIGWKLSEKGYSVNIFEKSKEIGNKVCSGLFSERILDFIPQSSDLIQNTINYTIIHFPKKVVKVNFSKKIYVMNHSQLDKLTANLAEKSGALINLNENISVLPKGFDRIIGCDGALSIVRKKLDLPESQYRLGILGFLEEKSDYNYAETWPCRDGFIWKIPRGTKTEYGIIARPEEAKIIFDKFLNKNNILLGKKQGRIIPQGFVIPSSDSVTLCGDAAGLTEPWSGGGVIWDLVAAEILLKSFPNFLNYRKLMKRFFLPQIILSKIITKIVYFFGFKMPFFLPKKVTIEPNFLLQ